MLSSIHFTIVNIIAICVIAILIIEILSLKFETKKLSKSKPDYEERQRQKGELQDNYLVEFRGDRFGTISYINGTFSPDESTPSEGVGDNESEDGSYVKSPKKAKTIRVSVKPIDVLDELERVPTNWSLEGLDEKIQILKDKEKLIVQQHAKREVVGLLQCLENRKKYNTVTKSGKTFREYFSMFDTTTDEKIQILLSKYNFRRDLADIFIPEFPKDAIQAMTEYTNVVDELCQKKPLFYVIATQEDFKQSYNKRDPILLALSPFGFYYCILGAWDKEMMYLPEL
jgi:hypothetical protein